MRILILDDLDNKCTWIKEILEQQNIEHEQILYLKEAYQKILKETYNGIILDMQFPIQRGSKKAGRAGEIFLKILKSRNIQIPVLGNSTINFPSPEEYPFLKGKLEGYETIDERKKLIEFLENIKEQSI